MCYIYSIQDLIMRIFISHSSKDKTMYCDMVVQKLKEKIGANSIVYDSMTFEAGEKSIDEINRTLAITDLYVILLSTNAVESNWVKYELKEANKKLSRRSLTRVYPVIIDSSLLYSDKRIPKWLKEYNLKYIARPAKCAKLIIEQAKSVNYIRHPDFQNQNDIFVGRNSLINDFETRIDDLSQQPLNTFIVSGLPNIGRKSLIRQCCIKGTIISSNYEFPIISLSYQESIEDFIIKLHDLGFTVLGDSIDFTHMTLAEKNACAVSLSQSISKLSEIILIKDDGCIIDYRGNMAEWFKEIISNSALQDKLVFAIVTRYKTNYETIRNIPSATYMNVPELTQQERRGLLRRLADVEKLELNRTELDSVCKHLTGYPTQVQYAVNIIKNEGYPYLSKRYKLLSEFNEQEVSSILERHKDNPKVLQILALISKYDAISRTMLYDILNTTAGYVDCYNTLYQESFFELEGVNREYVRLNEVVRNYIARSGAKALPAHQIKANELFEQMFSDNSSSWYDTNDFLLAIRENVTQGKNVPREYIIPSVYLKSMTDLYSDMKYENVVNLANLALQNSDNTDHRILYEIRYQLCSALAKLKCKDFLTEVQKLDNDDDRRFLTAFYYRQIGKNNFALNTLNELLKKRPEMSKAKREKVLVLKNLQQFEDATDLAKENYYWYSDNPYHIQAYFDCLINTYHDNPDDVTLWDLLEKLGRIKSEKAQSMYSRCNALYLAYAEHNYEAAINEINKAGTEFPKDRKYSLVVKFDIARLFRRVDMMQSVISELESDGANSNTVVICKSKLLAVQNDIDEAVKFFKSHITYFTDESKTAFCEKLRAYGEPHMLA